MDSALAYVSLVSGVLAVVLAVAFDVPILHVLLPPEGEWSERWLTAGSFLMLVLLYLGLGLSTPAGPRLLNCAWVLGLVYGWWALIWHLRERR